MNAEGIFEHAVSFERSETRGLAFALGFFFSFRLSIVMISVHLLGVEPGTGSALSLGLDLMLLGVICFSSLGIQPAIGSISSWAPCGSMGPPVHYLRWFESDVE